VAARAVDEYVASKFEFAVIRTCGDVAHAQSHDTERDIYRSIDSGGAFRGQHCATNLSLIGFNITSPPFFLLPLVKSFPSSPKVDKKLDISRATLAEGSLPWQTRHPSTTTFSTPASLMS
jgi:hypothetical protein